ncbi:DUF4177 domain-containing protein [Thioalkalivibrio sp. HK1]|uniref:DUF4177 domain-containing protein n=1 Tax=Thioalkalivibrio sp. HK1 TaxID=1469245 RepID=UPI000471D778|nr:DUF4177 domain-containing protein [Thioalkalivibrio sp. HK1]
MKYKEYKVIALSEGMVGSVLLGASALPLEKIERTLNQEAQDGWQIVFQLIESRRIFLFWSMETVILTFGRA